MPYIGIEPLPTVSERTHYGVIDTPSNVITLPETYVPNNIEVFINGSRIPPSDYVALDGNTVHFLTTYPAGTEWLVQGMVAAILSVHNVVQSTGSSTSDVMSQKAVTDAIDPPFTIAVIGDSLSTENPLMEMAWPSLLEKYLNASGASKFKILNFSVNGFNSYRANTEVLFNDLTAAAAVVSAKPDLVIVGLDMNDVTSGLSGRTLAQAKSDISTLFSTIKTGLPNAVLCHLKTISHDTTHATPISTTLYNRHVIPFFWQKKTSGYLSGLMAMELADDSTSAATRTNYLNTVDYWSYVAALPEVDNVLSMDLFRIARIGGIGVDLLHPNDLGKMMQVGYLAKSLTASVHPIFANISTKGHSWSDPDALFNGYLSSSGGKWVGKTSVDNAYLHLDKMSSEAGLINVDNWALSFKGAIGTDLLNGDTLSRSRGVGLFFKGCRPKTEIQRSENGGAFGSVGIAPTNSSGDSAVFLAGGLFPNSSYTFRYKIGTDVYGPITLSVVA